MLQLNSVRTSSLHPRWNHTSNNPKTPNLLPIQKIRPNYPTEIELLTCLNSICPRLTARIPWKTHEVLIGLSFIRIAAVTTTTAAATHSNPTPTKIKRSRFLISSFKIQTYPRFLLSKESIPCSLKSVQFIVWISSLLPLRRITCDRMRVSWAMVETRNWICFACWMKQQGWTKIPALWMAYKAKYFSRESVWISKEKTDS